MANSTMGSELGGRIEEGSRRLGKELSERGEEARELVENGLDEAHSMAEEAVDTVVGKYELARVRGLEVTDSVRGAVAERPLTSLGIAVGAGALVGWLLRR